MRRNRLTLLGLLGGLTVLLTWAFRDLHGQQRLVPTPQPAETAPPPRLVQPEGIPLPPCPDMPPLCPELGPLPYCPETATPFSPADPPTPVVRIRVRVPATAAAGQELEYRIHVSNDSTAAAHHVTVRNPLPANARFVRANPEPNAKEPYLEWQFGTLAAGASREIVLTLQPTGEGDVSNCPRVQFEHGQCVTTRFDRPQLQLRKLGPSRATLYDNLTFRLEVSNTGTVSAGGVTLIDILPEGMEHASQMRGLKWELGTLEPGQSRTLEYQAIAKKAGRLCNKASVTSGSLRQEAEYCVEVGEVRIELIKRGPEARQANRSATYQLTIVNPNVAPIQNVILTDPVPAGMKFTSATNGGQLINDQVIWLLGNFGPGERRTVQVTMQAQQAGEIVNQATVTADRGLTATAQAKTSFEGAAGLTVDIDDADDPVEVGRPTRYNITVINQGQAAAGNVRIVAIVPEQMEATSAKGPTLFKIDGQRVVFEPLVSLAAQAEAIYQIEVRPKKAGDVRFQVELTADQLPAGPVRRQESTNIYDPNGQPGGARLQPPMPAAR